MIYAFSLFKIDFELEGIEETGRVLELAVLVGKLAIERAVELVPVDLVVEILTEGCISSDFELAGQVELVAEWVAGIVAVEVLEVVADSN